MKDIIIFLDMDVTGATPQLLKAAGSLNLNPVMLSASPWTYPDVPAANAVRMDEMTLDSIVGVIDRIGHDRIAGVYSPRSHRAELAARVAREIGRPHSDPDAIAICHSKLRTRDVLDSKGIRDVAYRNVISADDAYAFAKEMGGTAVVKPFYSSGATGVRVCRSPEEARRHAASLLEKRRNGVLVEQFIDGPVFGVELFDGRTIGVRRFFMSDHPTPLILAHEAPAQVAPEIYKLLCSQAERIIEAVGHMRGFAHVQFVLNDGRPYLIEINPRIPASLSPKNIKSAFGVDAAEICLRFACGLPYSLEPRERSNGKICSAVSFLLKVEQPITSVEGIEAAAEVPFVTEVGVLPSQFGRRGTASGLADFVAYVFTEADTNELAMNSAMEALNKLQQIPYGRILGWLRRRLDKSNRRNLYSDPASIIRQIRETSGTPADPSQLNNGPTSGC